jgi:hypothetical protein
MNPRTKEMHSARAILGRPLQSEIRSSPSLVNEVRTNGPRWSMGATDHFTRRKFRPASPTSGQVPVSRRYGSRFHGPSVNDLHIR